MTNPKKIDLDRLLDENGNEIPTSHDIRSLGPSDSSDTGADMVGVAGLDNPIITAALNQRGRQGDMGIADDLIEGDLGRSAVHHPDLVLACAGEGSPLQNGQGVYRLATGGPLEFKRLDFTGRFGTVISGRPRLDR